MCRLNVALGYLLTNLITAFITTTQIITVDFASKASIGAEMNESKVNLITWNINGAQKSMKRDKILLHLKTLGADIAFLQETHATPKTEKFWRRSWQKLKGKGATAWFSHGTQAAGGTMTLIAEGIVDQAKLKEKDDEGRVLIVEIQTGPISTDLVNTYGPNGEAKNFWETMLQRDLNERFLLAGDLNQILDGALDRESDHSFRQRAGGLILLDQLEEEAVFDIWREFHPNERDFTYKKDCYGSRLDLVLASQRVAVEMIDAEIMNKIESDHYPVRVSWKLQKPTKKPPFWKFNRSMLADEVFIKETRLLISRFKSNTEGLTDAGERWLNLKECLKAHCIEFQKQQNKRVRKEILALQHKIEIGKVLKHKAKVEHLTKELEATYERQIQLGWKSSKALFYENFEKGSKQFFQQIRPKGGICVASSVVDAFGNEITDSQNIANTQRDFYENLYAKDTLEQQDRVQDQFLNIPEEQKLSLQMATIVNKIVSKEELGKAVKKLKKGKACGPDGFPIEIWAEFWEQIGDVMYNMVNEAIQKKQIPEKVSQGVLMLLPKKGDLRKTENWRPISLLNCDFKAVSAVLAARLNNVLPGLIDVDQRGFVAGRLIGENALEMQTVIEFCQETGKKGALINLDFRKAFDSLDWGFTRSALKAFGLPGVILDLFDCLHHKPTSQIIHGENLSTPFQIQKGVLQGAPSSPPLFVIAVETMFIEMKRRPAVMGIELDPGLSTLAMRFADDASITSEYDKDSFNGILGCITEFGQASGLTLNEGKTEVLPLGPTTVEELENSPLNKFSIKAEKCKSLGNFYNVKAKPENRENYTKKAEKMGQISTEISKNYVSLLGRNLLAKSLLVSQWLYQLSMLPSPTMGTLLDVQDTLFSYLWQGKNGRMSKDRCYLPKEKLGLRFPNVVLQNKAFKAAWMARAIKSGESAFARFLASRLRNPIRISLEANLSKRTFLRTQVKGWLPKIWKEIIECWCDCNSRFPQNASEVAEERVWLNGNILSGKNRMPRNQIPGMHEDLRMRDLWSDQDQNWLSWREIKMQFPNTTVTEKEWKSLICAIPKKWKTWLQREGLGHPRNKLSLIESTIAGKPFKPARTIYSVLIDKIKPKTFFGDGWNKELNTNYDKNWWYTTEKSIKQALPTRLKSVQFQILNRAYWCNKTGNQAGFIDSPLCQACGEEESLSHMFWSCKKIRLLWDYLGNKIEETIQRSFSFDMESALFGHKAAPATVIGIMLKKEIIQSRIDERLPNAISVWYSFEHYISAIQIIAARTGRSKGLQHSWGDFFKWIKK